MKLGIRLHLAGLPPSDDTISILEILVVERCRFTVHNWVQKADLQSTDDTNANPVAVDRDRQNCPHYRDHIADDGVGIPTEDRTKIFENGYTTATQGTGFGLSIVKQIVDAYEWEIHVTESDDGGARFEITGVTITDREEI